jgi:seryl-tRNA synthetase
MGIGDKVKSEGLKMGMKAMSKLMESPERAEKMMKAVETVQRSRERVDETAARLLNLSQLPSKDDVRELSRQAGRLRRQMKKIMAALDDLEAKL